MMNRETHDPESTLAEGRGTEELRVRLLSVRKRKQAAGGRTPAVEAVRQRLIDEQREERGSQPVVDGYGTACQ